MTTFWRTIGFWVLAITLGSCSEGTQEKAAPQIKNYILITLDTVRADHLGIHGYKEARTPNMDELARGGARFTTAISTTPITMPSHSSIMTGLYPFRHGVRNNGAFRLDASQTTLAERFQAAGYDTAAVIAALVLDSKFGLDQGFRVYDDDLYSGDEPKMFMFKEIRAKTVIDKAIKLVEGELREPFFLWVHLFDAHADYVPPPPYDMLFLKQPYDGEIAYVDKQLGRFFSALKAKGLDQRTLTVLTADHGDSLGDHGEDTHGIFVYRSTTHVPFIVSGPGIAPLEVTEVVSGVDIAPMLTELAGLKPMETDGVSLASALHGGKLPERDGVLVESLNPRLHFGWHELRGIDSGDTKYIQAPKEEYYELNKDPGETNNLWQTNAGQAGALKAVVTDAFKNDKMESLQIQKIDRQTQEMLEALGYMSEVTIAKGDDLPDPKDVAHEWVDLQKCQQMVRMKIDKKAVPCLEGILEKSPSNWTASLSLTGVLRRLGRIAEAEKVLERALKLDPANVKALENLASIKKDQGKHEEAAETLRSAAAAGERDPEPWTLLGDMYQEQGKTKEALEAYGEALKCDEIYTSAYVGIANTFHRAGVTEKALSYLNEATRIEPKNHAAWYNLGVVHDSQKHIAEAEKAYRRAAEINPEHAMTHNNLGSLLSRAGRKDEAVASFRLALKADPEHVESRYNLATLLIDSEPETAARMLNEVLKLKPELIPARTNLAFAHEKMGQTDQAMEHFRWVVEHAKKAPGVLISMAKIEMKRGRAAAARKLVKQAVEQDGERAKSRIETDPILGKLLK